MIHLLRPWLSELYSCLHKSQPCLVHCTASQLFSTKPPVRFALQLLSAYSIKFHCTLELQHISGNQNVLADELSRFKDIDAKNLDPALRVRFSIDDLVLPSLFDIIAKCAKRPRKNE